MIQRSVQAASRKSVEDVADASFDSVNSDMKKDKERMWTSVDIQIECTEKSGCHLTRHKLVKRIIATFDGEVILFPHLVLLIF